MSAEETAAVEDTAADEHEAEEHKPSGTILIAFTFLFATAVVWTLTYLLLLERG